MRLSIWTASRSNLVRTHSNSDGGATVAKRSRQATEQRKEEHATFVQAQAENQAATQLVEAAKNKLNKSRSSMPGLCSVLKWLLLATSSVKIASWSCAFSLFGVIAASLACLAPSPRILRFYRPNLYKAPQRRELTEEARTGCDWQRGLAASVVLEPERDV